MKCSNLMSAWLWDSFGDPAGIYRAAGGLV